MNDGNLEQLEDLLRELPLRRPSPELDRRVEATWQARSSRPNRWTVGAAVATLAATAAGLLLILTWDPAENRVGDRPAPVVAGVEKPPAPAPPEKSPPQPIRIEKVWTTQSTAGVVVHDGDVPMQRVHQQIVRHVRWIDEQNHVNIEWTIPSDQTVLVPLEYN
ncbi:MAG: hypothetical protein HQ567_04725 [Candidatus Nealsonbacteria bacterium]|nr:hypothetical protein [Candidatus Nealsonbacteria bacterium]